MNINTNTELEEFLQKYDRIILDEQGIIKLLPAEFYHSLDNIEVNLNIIIW